MTIMRLLICRESSANPTQVTPSRAAILQCVVMVSYMYLITWYLSTCAVRRRRRLVVAGGLVAIRSRRKTTVFSIGSSLGFYRYHRDTTEAGETGYYMCVHVHAS
jgi:hypothetical protein